MAPFDNPIEPGSAYADLRFPGVQDIFRQTGSTVIRMFAEWDYWPNAGFKPQLDAMLANVAIARKMGLKVILTSRGFPEAKPFEWSSLDLMGYNDWVTAICTWFQPDYFEFVNEPNAEIHPHSISPIMSATLFMQAHEAVADVNRQTGAQIKLMGPATADSPNYLEFTHEFIRESLSVGAHLNSLHWSHHNYNDVATYGVDRVMRLHKMVRKDIYLTEGGLHRPSAAQGETVACPSAYDSFWDEVQAQRLKKEFEDLNRLPYIRLFTNFLGYSDIYYDSGLYRPNPDNNILSDPATFKRPAFDVWAKS